MNESIALSDGRTVTFFHDLSRVMEGQAAIDRRIQSVRESIAAIEIGERVRLADGQRADRFISAWHSWKYRAEGPVGSFLDYAQAVLGPEAVLATGAAPANRAGADAKAPAVEAQGEGQAGAAGHIEEGSAERANRSEVDSAAGPPCEPDSQEQPAEAAKRGPGRPPGPPMWTEEIVEKMAQLCAAGKNDTEIAEALHFFVVEQKDRYPNANRFTEDRVRSARKKFRITRPRKGKSKAKSS